MAQKRCQGPILPPQGLTAFARGSALAHVHSAHATQGEGVLSQALQFGHIRLQLLFALDPQLPDILPVS